MLSKWLANTMSRAASCGAGSTSRWLGGFLPCPIGALVRLFDIGFAFRSIYYEPGASPPTCHERENLMSRASMTLWGALSLVAFEAPVAATALIGAVGSPSCEQPTGPTAAPAPTSQADITSMMRQWLAEHEAVSRMDAWWQERTPLPNAPASTPAPLKDSFGSTPRGDPNDIGTGPEIHLSFAQFQPEDCEKLGFLVGSKVQALISGR